MADDRLVAAAFGLALVGGAALAVASVVSVPPAVAGLGAVAFVLGLLLAAVFGFRSARRGGESVARSLWRGLRTLWSWFWEFLP